MNEPLYPKGDRKISPTLLRDAPCPYYGECGGCQLQHLTGEGQLQEKLLWLKESLGSLVPEEKIHPIIPSPVEWNYRRRIQVHVGPRGELGFYARGSQRVVDIEECLIAEEKLNQVLPKVRAMARAALQDPKRPTELNYELTLKEDGTVSIERRPGPYGSGPRPASHGAGQGFAERFFLQVNEGANEKLKSYLKEKLNSLEIKRVLELHAGTGNLSYALARPGQDWTAVEVQAAAF